MNTYRSLALAFFVTVLLTGDASILWAQDATTTTTQATGPQTPTANTSGGSTISNAASIGTDRPTIGTSEPKGPRSGAGSTTSMPSSSNPFVTTYIDYMALGKPSLYANNVQLLPLNITTSTFGQPIYGNVATKGAAGGAGQGGQTTATGFSTIGQVRAPSYITALSPEIPFVKHKEPALRASAKAVIEQSSYINNKQLIEVSVNDGAVTLRGQVGTEKERRIAETMLRLTPGVRDVQNLLTVAGGTLP